MSKTRSIRWDKLDNTANLFPSIAGESMTNVYRISVTLTDEIDSEKLQEALANTTTITNIGNIKVEPEYEPYITGFYSFIPMSKGQPMKGTICSYRDTLVFTFSSILADTMIQRSFFKKLVNDGVEVTIETNGEYYD